MDRRLLAAALVGLGLCSAPVGRAQAPAAAGQRAEAARSAALAAPDVTGGASLNTALKERRSVRDLADSALSAHELAQLCWALQGITDDKGHRTAPSAMATYPLEVYVFVGRVTGVDPGLYRYSPQGHSLTLLQAGDSRAAFVDQAVGQAWTKTAPAIFVITQTASRVARAGTVKGERYAWIEAGLAAENFLLEAVSLNLGSTFVGGFKDEEVSRFLKLPAGEQPIAVLPVGHKK